MTKPTHTSGMLWRGDLVAAMLAEDQDAHRTITQALGLVEQPHTDVDPEGKMGVADAVDSGTFDDTADVFASAANKHSASYPDNLQEAIFWQPVRYKALATIERRKEAGHGYTGWPNQPSEPPEEFAIAPGRVVHPRVRKGLSRLLLGRQIDIRKVIRKVARAERLDRLPRKRRRRWGHRFLVVFDQSPRLIPFFADQQRLYEELEDFTPAGGTVSLFLTDLTEPPTYVNADNNIATWKFDQPARILVMSDLGGLAVSGRDALQAAWYRWARELTDRGFEVVALLPVPPVMLNRTLRKAMTTVYWQQSVGQFVADWQERQERVDELLTAVSPVVRLEPGLLRTIRRLLPDCSDASLESDVWQHTALTRRHPNAATLDIDLMEQKYRPRFAELDADRKDEILKAIHAWRYEFRNAPEVWFQEILNLDSDTQDRIEALFPGDIDAAKARLKQLATIARQNTSESTRAIRGYGGRATQWFAETVWQDKDIQQAVHDLWSAAPQKQRRDRGGLDPSLMGGQQREPTRVTVSQRGGDFLISDDRVDDASFVCQLWTRNRFLGVAERDAFWKSGQPPTWASNWGRDEYGPWCEFEVTTGGYESQYEDAYEQGETLKQRMRWIPGGHFQMGSATKAVGELYNERPQHRATISRGFWMFDTPVAQELWQAVMGENPGQFQGARRPVENVSWEDAQQFLSRINSRVGLDLHLPTEAQWEYACRAGTQTAFSFGDDSDKLASYGWYSKNANSQTHDVGEQLPNGWGLFDMHGNVWEWCSDWVADYTDAAAIDPTGPEAGRGRVLRGGSWGSAALYARCATRSGRGPGLRGNSIGFRCAQVHGSDSAAEPLAEDGEVAEPQASPTRGGEATALEIPVGARITIPIPKSSAIVVRTDTEEYKFDAIARPEWATAIGRDRYGMWAEWTLDAAKISQRMRWVPPGVFEMGSPESESGRWDDEGPQHQVTLTCGFWLFETPVTQVLWEAVMDQNPSEFKAARRPVETVSWDDAQQFISRMNLQIDGLHLELPTEAQWEYACRAGSQTAFGFGDDPGSLDKYAWFYGNSGAETHEVGSKLPNGWGFYDMHGNVWEWCADWNGGYSTDATQDPRGPDEGHSRVLRGGGWSDPARLARCAARDGGGPGVRNSVIGFRCAQVHEAGKDREQMSEESEQSRDATPDRSE